MEPASGEEKVVVVENYEAGIKLFGQEVKFKWPTLLEVARNGNVVMYGDNMTTDNKPRTVQTLSAETTSLLESNNPSNSTSSSSSSDVVDAKKPITRSDESLTSTDSEGYNSQETPSPTSDFAETQTQLSASL